MNIDVLLNSEIICLKCRKK